jgi:hypothetical protein
MSNSIDRMYGKLYMENIIINILVRSDIVRSLIYPEFIYFSFLYFCYIYYLCRVFMVIPCTIRKYWTEKRKKNNYNRLPNHHPLLNHQPLPNHHPHRVIPKHRTMMTNHRQKPPLMSRYRHHTKAF